MCNLSNHIPRINYIYLTPKLIESPLIKWFGDDIDKFFIGSHMRNDYVPHYGMNTQEMVYDVHVFGS
jgi:hypothetical protein